MARVIENYVAGMAIPNKWGSKKFEHKSKLLKLKKKARQNRKKARKSNS